MPLIDRRAVPRAVYPPVMPLFGSRRTHEVLTAQRDAALQRSLDTAVNAIKDRMDQSDKIGTEQHERIEKRLTAVEAEVRDLKSQHDGEEGEARGRSAVVAPIKTGILMPLAVILIVVIVGAASTALVVRAAGQEAAAVVTGETCKEATLKLIAQRDNYSTSQYRDALQQLADQGCATTSALTQTP